MDLDQRGSWEELGGVEGETVVWIYYVRKILFLIKGKNKTKLKQKDVSHFQVAA